MAFVVFLVDRYCLGVKNVIMAIAPRAHYQKNMYDKLAEHYELIPLKPECARKLVEGAVDYARNLGLEPYHEYRTGQLIFGDIRAEDCTEEYEYGKDGKPFFIAGPYDDEARCRYICKTLEESCGPDGSHYIMPVRGTDEFQFLDSDEEGFEDEGE